MGVLGRFVVEESVWNVVANSRAWTPVQKVCGCGERLSPVLSRHVCMEEHRATDVVQCAKKAFSLAILWGGIWTREA